MLCTKLNIFASIDCVDTNISPLVTAAMVMYILTSDSKSPFTLNDTHSGLVSVVACGRIPVTVTVIKCRKLHVTEVLLLPLQNHHTLPDAYNPDRVAIIVAIPVPVVIVIIAVGAVASSTLKRPEAVRFLSLLIECYSILGKASRLSIVLRCSVVC
jgi:hypothetical protein